MAANYEQHTALSDFVFPSELTSTGNWTLATQIPMDSKSFDLDSGAFHVRDGQSGLYYVSLNAQLKYSSAPAIELRKNGAGNPGLSAGIGEAGASASELEHEALLSQVIPQVTWKECFRLSSDGRSSSTFHNKVRNSCSKCISKIEGLTRSPTRLFTSSTITTKISEVITVVWFSRCYGQRVQE